MNYEILNQVVTSSAAITNVHFLLELLAPNMQLLILLIWHKLFFLDLSRQNTYESYSYVIGRILSHFILGLHKLFGSIP